MPPDRFASVAAFLRASRIRPAASSGADDSRRRQAIASPASLASGNTSAESSRAARPANGSAPSSAGVNSHRRQRVTPATTPGDSTVGNTPARSSEDLPLPLAPEDADERAALVCAPRQDLHEFLLGPLTAEEDGGMFGPEHRQTAERGAGVPGDRRSASGLEDLADPLAQQRAQMHFQLLLELVQGVELVEGRLEGAVTLDEMAQPEVLHQFPLLVGALHLRRDR